MAVSVVHVCCLWLRYVSTFCIYVQMRMDVKKCGKKSKMFHSHVPHSDEELRNWMMGYCWPIKTNKILQYKCQQDFLFCNEKLHPLLSSPSPLHFLRNKAVNKEITVETEIISLLIYQPRLLSWYFCETIFALSFWVFILQLYCTIHPYNVVCLFLFLLQQYSSSSSP